MDPTLRGICSACSHTLYYINYIMSHNVARDNLGGNGIENLRVSCLSCNSAMSVMPFDEYKEKHYPSTQKHATNDFSHETKCFLSLLYLGVINSLVLGDSI